MSSLGGLHVKHALQCGIFGTNSAFVLGPRKTTENLVELAGRRTIVLIDNTIILQYSIIHIIPLPENISEIA
jgi:hypothetical protein